jgi:hypothetical protein
MSLARAAGLIWMAGFKNRIRRQLQRMRQPKYLIATLVGALYFWSVIGRRLRFSGGAMRLGPEVRQVVEAVLVASALLTIAGTWLFGGDKAELSFTEAEIQFLFPAPASRRMVLNYRLSKSVLRTFFSALIMTLLSGGWLTGHPFMFLVGAWLCFATLNLHLTGATLTRASLIESGRFGLKRRLGTVGIASAVVAALLWWVLRVEKPAAPSAWTVDGLIAWMSALASTPPLSWILFPVRAPIRVALARDIADFASSLPAALGVLGVHYGWVLSSNVSFEEASVEAAERRARIQEARRSGRGRRSPVSKRRFVPFRLAASGRPETALVWKNLIAAIRVAVPRMLLFLIAMGFAGAMSMTRRFPAGPVISAACVFIAALLVLLGPNAMRIDFRQDLSQIDILRSLPMTGAQIVWAEMLGPGLIIACLQWLLISAAVGLSATTPMTGFELWKRVALGFGAAAVAPALVLVNLCIQNAGVLLFPSWVSVDPRQARGIEALGQRLLTLAGSLVVLFFALLPAGIVGGVVAVALWAPLHFAVFPLAGAAATAVIGFELRLAVRWLGAVFDRFDLTAP